jgi:hypothetical protein
MSIALGDYLWVIDRETGDPDPGPGFQNFFIGETRDFNGDLYRFAPFVIDNKRVSAGGDRGRASLVTINNEVTMVVMSNIIRRRQALRVATVVIGYDSGSFYENYGASEETWVCNGGSIEEDKITINLMSPLDAVTSNFPRRVLSQNLVGSVPPTGSIFSA